MLNWHHPYRWTALAVVPILTLLLAAPAWADGPGGRGGRDRGSQRADVSGRDNGRGRSQDRPDYDAHDRTRVQVGVHVAGRNGAFDLQIGRGHVGHRPPPVIVQRPAPRVYLPPPPPPPVYCPPPRRVIIVPAPEPCPPPVIVRPYPALPPVCDDRGGWDLLTDGSAYAARDAFARKADEYPTAPKPRIGYAISSALLHDYSHAVAAMKDAVRLDPEALLRVPHNGLLDRRIVDTITNLDRDADRFGVPPGDVFFTQAALQLTLDNLHAAHAAVEQALRYCHDDPAVLSLRDLIEARIDDVGHTYR
jgi:hypothetical protein